MNVDFVKHLKFQSNEELIKTLVKQFEAAGGDPSRFPLVRLTIGTHIFSGVPVKIQELQKEPWLALLSPDGGPRGMEALSFVPVRGVSTVTIENLRVQMGAVTEGSGALIDPGNAPSRLNVERAAAEFKNLTINWDGAAESAQARTMIHELLKAWQTATAEIAADKMGKEALQTVKGFTLTFSETASLEIVREGNNFTLTVGPRADIKTLKSNLRTQLEAKL